MPFSGMSANSHGSATVRLLVCEMTRWGDQGEVVLLAERIRLDAEVVLHGDVTGVAGVLLPGAGVHRLGGLLLVEVEQLAVGMADTVAVETLLVVLEPPTAVEHVHHLAPVLGTDDPLPAGGVDDAVGQVPASLGEDLELAVVGIRDRLGAVRLFAEGQVGPTMRR
jgi:hypothetical protein